jgi:hypothetical protein
MALTRQEEDALIAAAIKDISSKFMLVPNDKWPDAVIREVRSRYVLIPRKRWYVGASSFFTRVIAAAVVLAGVSYFSGMVAAGNVLRDEGITHKLEDIDVAHARISKEDGPLGRLKLVEDTVSDQHIRITDQHIRITGLEEQQAPQGAMIPWNSSETQDAKLPPGWKFCDGPGAAADGRVVNLDGWIVGAKARGGAVDKDNVRRYVWIGKIR